MRYLITLLAILISVCLYGQNIDSLVKARVIFQETPGIAVGVFQKGKSAFYYYGLANTEKKIPVGSQTQFEIGSITKTFTASLLTHMIITGKVRLDDAVQQYLPDSVHMPAKDGKVITLENLATHRSGLPRMPDNFKPADPENPYLDYDATSLYDFLNHHSLKRGIGEKYEYSNLGMGLLGHVLTRVSGQTYANLVSTIITAPLHMNHTVLNNHDASQANTTRGYNGDLPAASWTWSDASVLAPAGALLSTAEDMMKYVLANMKAKDKALQLAQQPRHDAGQDSLEIGLAWHIQKGFVWHNGGTGGYRTFCGFDPKHETAVVVLTNSSTGADDLGLYLLDHRLPLKKIKPFIEVDKKLLQEYTGVYMLTPFFNITVALEGDHFTLQGSGQPKITLYASSETRFFIKVVEAQIEFIRDTNGKVTQLILTQNGVNQKGSKIK